MTSLATRIEAAGPEDQRAWKPENFEVAYYDGPTMVAGYVHRGLGLYIVIPASPKGRRPPTWSLTHLGTGHRVALIEGKVATAFPIATEIAEAGDWDFLSLEGYKDRFPDAGDRVAEICSRHSKYARRGGDGMHANGFKVAQQIAANRP